MQGERKAIVEKFRDRLNQIFQIRPIRRCYCKIICIAGIILYMEFMLYKLIKFVHINVREKLRREVSYGNTPGMASAVSLSLSLSRTGTAS